MASPDPDSPVFGKVEPKDIVSWIFKDKLPVRFQIQMHKVIWDPKATGVEDGECLLPIAAFA